MSWLADIVSRPDSHSNLHNTHDSTLPSRQSARDSHVRSPSSHLGVIVQGVLEAAAGTHPPARLEVALAVAGAPRRPVIMACGINMVMLKLVDAIMITAVWGKGRNSPVVGHYVLYSINSGYSTQDNDG